MCLNHFKLSRILLLIALLWLSACQGNQAAATNPVASNTSSAAATAPTGAATAGAEVAATATPTALPAPIVATATSSPAEETEPETPVVVPTEPIPGIIGPVFPEGVNPLTGETVSNPALLARRPLAIKISNYPPVVRPQSGLNSADLIFEHYAEGGVTRFTAIFFSHDANPVGSVRSGRLIDLEIPKMYDAAFAYSGSSGPVQQFIRESIFFNRVISPDFGHGGFFRVDDPNKAFEHTLFTSTDNLHFILQQRGENVAPTFHNGMTFSSMPLQAGDSASTIEIQYLGTNVFWQYNESTGRYYRWTDGVPHNDANTNEQVNFRNVAVVAAHHEDTDILEDFVAGGHYSIQIQVWGEGPVSIFRDGVRIDGRWRRDDPNDMLSFYDLDGNPMPLAPGNTFVQLVPLGFSDLTVQP